MKERKPVWLYNMVVMGGGSYEVGGMSLRHITEGFWGGECQQSLAFKSRGSH